MSYRFKEPGHGPDGPRMLGGMDSDKMSRDDMDDFGRGSRPPFGRGRGPSPSRDKGFMDRSRDFGGFGRDDMPSGRDRDRSPMRGGYEDRFPERDRFKRDDIPYRGREDLNRKEPLRGFMDDREPFRDKFMDNRRFDMGFNPRYDMPEDQYKHRSVNYPNAPSQKNYFRNDMMKPNECEIIVVNKQQRGYAENIEGRMKNLGIQVDILFLKDEALLVQTIDDIARRGSLYAMVVSPLNETHGSVTLNILYGTPQEHRNMPLDDALKLVARNFHDHIRSQRELMDRDRSERGVYFGAFPADREVQFLLRLLADGRQASIGELDTVIKYLTERRDKMKNPQGDPSTSAPAGQAISSDSSVTQKPTKDDVDLAQKEQDLQNRIINIMNQGPGGDSGAPLMQGKATMGMNMNPGVQGDISGSRQTMSPGMGIGQTRPPVSQNQPLLSGHPPGGNQPGMAPEQSGSNRGLINPNQLASSGNPSNNKTPASSTYINFDNPSVKKALDNLMQSGPNLLKSLSGASTSTTQVAPDSAPNKNIGHQRGPPTMGEMGNMGPQGGNMGPQGGNMGQQGGMVFPQGRNMGPPEHNMGPLDNRNMGPIDNRNMGPLDRNMGPHDGRNMGPHDSRGMGSHDGRGMGMSQGHGMNQRQPSNMAPGMGHRSGSPYQDRQGMYGGGGAGNSNMMNSRHFMAAGGGSGPMGNQGMNSGRRY